MRISLLVLVAISCIAMLAGACRDIFLPFAESTPPPPLFQKGIAYDTYSSDAYITSTSDSLLEELKTTGTEWVRIVVIWHQKNEHSTKIYRDDDTPTDEALAHVVRKIHDLGMKVTLEPTVDLENDEWRGYISFGEDERKWRAWFKSYRNFIVYYAKLAQEWDVEQLSVGVEYKGTTYRKTDWQNIVREVRTHYHGYLTYAANFVEYQEIQWWGDLDFVGIDAYFTLTPEKDPTIEELIE